MAPSNDTTAPLRAKIIRKRTKVKASIAATAPGSPKKRPTHQATAAAKSKAKATPRKRQPLPPIPTAFQFQDDKTGRKLIHPAALRYSLKLVDDELQSSTKAIAQSLLEHNQVVSQFYLRCGMTPHFVATIELQCMCFISTVIRTLQRATLTILSRVMSEISG